MKEKQYVLVKFEQNWADEFDVYGLAVYEKETWEKLKQDLINTGPYEFWFGSNQCFEDIDEDFIKESFIDQPITKEEVKVLKKHVFCHNSYGNFPWLEAMIEETSDDK